MIRSVFLILMLLVGGSLPAVAADQTRNTTGEITTVALRAGARVELSEPITLSDVADITGPLAEKLGGLIVQTPREGQGSGSVSIQAVRKLVLETVEESTVVVQGTTCELRGKNALKPAAPVATEDNAPAVYTLRDQVEAHLRAMYRVNTDSIRLDFDDRNDSLLSTPIEGRVFEIRALGSGRRVPLSVAVYQGTRVIAEGTVRVGITLKRSVAVTVAELARGVVISPEHLRAEERWVGADDSSATASTAIGQMTRRRVRPGETLTASHLEAPIAIRRGEVVMVRSVRGTAVVHLRARALDDGRIGETIELEHTTSRSGRADRKRVSATVLGPGRAMIGIRKDPG